MVVRFNLNLLLNFKNDEIAYAPHTDTKVPPGQVKIVALHSGKNRVTIFFFFLPSSIYDNNYVRDCYVKMMELEVYKADAFSLDESPHKETDATTEWHPTGNPAAICLVPAQAATWLTEQRMQHIASEINLSETTFLFVSNKLWFCYLYDIFDPMRSCYQLLAAKFQKLYHRGRRWKHLENLQGKCYHLPWLPYLHHEFE